MDSASVDFYEAVVEALKQRGVFDKLTCEVRAEILQVLKDPMINNSDLKVEEEKTKNQGSANNFVINELIKEYLDYNGYSHTADVLSVESGHPKKRANRVDLENVLSVHTGPHAKQVPLLYAMLANLRKWLQTINFPVTPRQEACLY